MKNILLLCLILTINATYSKKIIFEESYDISPDVNEVIQLYDEYNENDEINNIQTEFNNYYNSNFVITHDNNFLVLLESKFTSNGNNQNNFVKLLKITNEGELIFNKNYYTGNHTFAGQIIDNIDYHSLYSSSCLSCTFANSCYSCSPAIFDIDLEGNIIESYYLKDSSLNDVQRFRIFKDDESIEIVHGPAGNEGKAYFDNFKLDDFSLNRRIEIEDSFFIEEFGEDIIWINDWYYYSDNEILANGYLHNPYNQLSEYKEFIIKINYSGEIEVIEKLTDEDVYSTFRRFYLMTDDRVFINSVKSNQIYNRSNLELIYEFNGSLFDCPENSSIEYDNLDDGGFVFLINYLDDDEKSNVVIVRTDNEFNELWQTSFNSEQYIRFTGSIKKMNNNLAIVYSTTEEIEKNIFKSTLHLKIIEDNISSVNDYESNSFFSIHPNPASDYIEISFSNKGLQPFANSGEIEIYDVLGERVYSTKDTERSRSAEVGNGGSFSGYFDYAQQPIRIDVSHLPRGVYFVRVGERVEKFVKR